MSINLIIHPNAADNVLVFWRFGRGICTKGGCTAPPCIAVFLYVRKAAVCSPVAVALLKKFTRNPRSHGHCGSKGVLCETVTCKNDELKYGTVVETGTCQPSSHHSVHLQIQSMSYPGNYGSQGHYNQYPPPPPPQQVISSSYKLAFIHGMQFSDPGFLVSSSTP